MFDFYKYIESFNSGDDKAMLDEFWVNDLVVVSNRSDRAGINASGKEEFLGFLNWAHDGVREIMRVQTLIQNENNIFAEYKMFGGDKLDLYPDVNLGRLACRNNWEVSSIVDKIIRYEDGPCDPSWFEDMLVVSGDGFLDQPNLNIQWDTKGLPDGWCPALCMRSWSWPNEDEVVLHRSAEVRPRCGEGVR